VRKRIKIKQYIGNIVWTKIPVWDNGCKNSFLWKVYRAKPQWALSLVYNDYVMVNGKMSMVISKDEKIVFEKKIQHLFKNGQNAQFNLTLNLN
tara:strand:+ start:991 stop:1269 length:279 start_codon:yes stop_codon:yes gene_type:complete